MSKLIKQNKGNADFDTVRRANHLFIVQHYAGPVTSVSGAPV